MRPAPRSLVLCAAAFAVTAVAVALGAGDAAWLVWAVLGVLVAADLLLSRTGPLSVSASAPEEVFTGETVVMALALAGARRPIDIRIDWPDGLDGPEDAVMIPADGAAVARLPVAARRRGTWMIERLWMRWPSRMGLIEFTPRVALGIQIAVVPNIRPVQSGTIDVKVRSRLFGVKETLSVGDGSEFHQMRDFVQGMDLRSIDWKRSAQHRQLLAKEMRAERNHHVILALDNGHLMREEIDGLPKIDHAVNAALATAWAAALGGDLVGLFAFDAEPRLFMPPQPGRRAFARIRSRTAELRYNSVESNHTLAMSALMARTPRRSLIVVFSDFVDPTTAELLVENIAVLSRRHAVVFVALRDAELEALAGATPDSMDDVARAVAAGHMLRDRRLVMGRLARLGVRLIDVDPRDLTPALVSLYLQIKAREVL